jgi:flagellar hook-associated protein 3 FlgL
MRVASTTFSNNFLIQINQLKARQLELQNQAATGLKLSLPEDNPSAMGQVLDLQTEGAANTQYQANISQLQNKAVSTSSVISGLKTISDRAGEIATLAQDGTKSPADLANYATEVDQLIQQAVQVANTKDQNGYLLSGTLSDTAPFAATTNSSGQVTSVAYQGNTAVAQGEIAPNVTLTAQTLGANTTGSGPAGLITDSRSGADFLNHLIALRNDLQAGTPAAVQAIENTDAPNLVNDENNIINQISANGAVQSRLQAAGNLATQQGQAVTGQISQQTDADLAQTLTEFSQAQTAYQAALQSGSSIFNLSLLNYLH